MEHLIILLFKWQTLVGSVVGVFGALMVALVIFILNNFFQKYKDLRENIRSIEISLALGLNDIYHTEKNLQKFLERLEKVVIKPLRNGVSETQYFLSETNFPILSIHLDISLLKSKYRSYYVHNKILLITKSVKKVNEVFKEMKVNYEDIIKKAKFLIERGDTPTNQQQEYLKNNESFISFVNDQIDWLQTAKRTFAETKTYNLKLLAKKRLFIWRLEGISFKFFCNRRQIEEYKSTWQCLDRIDQAISGEVDKLIAEIEQRGNNADKFIAQHSFKNCIKDIFKNIAGIFRFKEKDK